MFEINLERKKSIKKDIENKNYENRKMKNHNIIMTGILIYCIAAFLIAHKTGNFNLLFATPIVSGGSVIYLYLDTITSFAREAKAHNNIIKLSKELQKNNVKTSAYALSNSVIINQTSKVIKEKTDEDINYTDTEKINDTYYLFLDNDSKIQGLLERKTHTKSSNKEIPNVNETKYYILEQNEIETLENRVSPVKKLVKVKNPKR